MNYFIQSCRPYEMTDPEGMNLCPEEEVSKEPIKKFDYLKNGVHQYIEWTWTRKNEIRKGDYVFIYFSKPKKYIGCMAEVMRKVPYNPNASNTIHYRACLKVIKRFDSSLNLDTLQENGLNGNIVGMIYLENNPTLKKFILSNIE